MTNSGMDFGVLYVSWERKKQTIPIRSVRKEWDSRQEHSIIRMHKQQETGFVRKMFFDALDCSDEPCRSGI